MDHEALEYCGATSFFIKKYFDPDHSDNPLMVKYSSIGNFLVRSLGDIVGPVIVAIMIVNTLCYILSNYMLGFLAYFNKNDDFIGEAKEAIPFLGILLLILILSPICNPFLFIGNIALTAITSFIESFDNTTKDGYILV